MFDIYVTKLLHFETNHDKSSMFSIFVKFVASCLKLDFWKVTREPTKKSNIKV